jgi:DNA polymerase-3 subunit epsilon
MASSSMISKNKSNKEKIKVILANKEETELHNNYFKT